MSSERVALAVSDARAMARAGALLVAAGAEVTGRCNDFNQLEQLCVACRPDAVVVDADLCPDGQARKMLAERLQCTVLPLAWFLQVPEPTWVESAWAAEERLRLIFAHGGLGIVITTLAGEILSVSPLLAQRLGYDAAALSTKNFVDLVDVVDRQRVQQFFCARPPDSAAPVVQELRLRGASDVWWRARVTLAAVSDRDGQPSTLLGLIEGVDRGPGGEPEVPSEYGSQRQSLVREVHHRIKNNLQGVTGILRRELGAHPELASSLKNAISQVNTLGMVYGLKSHVDHEAVPLVELLAGAGAAVESALESTFVLPPLAGLRDLELNAEEAVPIALVLNELMLNALKHRDPNSELSLARLEVARNDATVSLRIENRFKDGDGALEQIGGAHGNGLKLVRALLPARGATLSWYRKAPGVLVAELVLSPPVLRLAALR